MKSRTRLLSQHPALPCLQVPNLARFSFGSEPCALCSVGSTPRNRSVPRWRMDSDTLDAVTQPIKLLERGPGLLLVSWGFVKGSGRSISCNTIAMQCRVPYTFTFVGKPGDRKTWGRKPGDRRRENLGTDGTYPSFKKLENVPPVLAFPAFRVHGIVVFEYPIGSLRALTRKAMPRTHKPSIVHCGMLSL